VANCAKQRRDDFLDMDHVFLPRGCVLDELVYPTRHLETMKFMNVKECMDIIHVPNKTVVRSIFASSWKEPLDLWKQPRSKVRFLSVEYKSPSYMVPYPVFLEIDNAYYQSQNMLFTPLFVRYLLQHQWNPHAFNENNYILRIMDQDLTMITLRNDQYILLGETEYTICDII